MFSLSRYPTIPPAVWLLAETFELLYSLLWVPPSILPYAPPTAEYPSTVQSIAKTVFVDAWVATYPITPPTLLPSDLTSVLIAPVAPPANSWVPNTPPTLFEFVPFPSIVLSQIQADCWLDVPAIPPILLPYPITLIFFPRQFVTL